MAEISTLRGRAKRGAAREAVHNEALHQFSSVGYDGITTRGLAEAAGVNHSLITYHFGDKLGLWKAVMGDIFKSYLDRLATRTEGLAELEPEMALKLGIRDFVTFSSEHPELHRIMTIEGRQRTDRLEWLAEHFLRTVFENTKDLISKCQKRGTVHTGDPTRLYYAVLSLGGSVFAFAPEREVLSGPLNDPQEEVEAAIELIDRVIFTNKD